MLLKSTDDKSKRVRLLEELRQSPDLNARQRSWLEDELMRLQRGIAGERSAAHYLDNYLKDDPERLLLHDLRVSFEGETAQVDHLMMTRGMHVYLIETKNFNGEISINDQGEFSVRYGRDRVYGIESPMEQSRRHERVLRKVFERLDIKGRMGRAPAFHHCVLIDPKGIIHRPSAKVLDTTDVMKADQFPSWHQNRIDRGISVTEGLSALANLVSVDTLAEFAQKLGRQHRPADLLALPDFMQPRAAAPQPAQQTTSANSVAARRIQEPPRASASHNPEIKRKLVCATCGAKITFQEGKYCWNNEARFGGFQYCREHQAGR
jgi:hypothetical protein